MRKPRFFEKKHRAASGFRLAFIARGGMFLALAAFSACSPNPSDILLPAGDIKPPSILKAGQESPEAFKILFDETVRPVEKSFAFEPPAASATPHSEGSELTISFQPALEAGVEYSLSGEARDESGNTTRFLLSFVGYNDHPAELIINEVQTGKNSSASNPHRDYIEFLARKSGNIGGIHVSWASTQKLVAFTFPPCEVAANSLIVLHAAPEAIPEEMNETGIDLSASGGVDSSVGGRDFWTDAGGIPDETGAIMVRTREGDPPIDGIFFVSLSKTGEVDSAKIAALLDELSLAGFWPCLSPPRWEDGFAWKSSPARPLHRKREAESGPDQWYVGEAGSQSPGSLMPGFGSSRTKKASAAKR
ncbi:MAG: hypothetical protein ACYC2S_05635 [Spirochaetales bacterium]